MRGMKRILGPALLALALAAALAGCGGSSGNPGGSAEADNPAEQADAVRNAADAEESAAPDTSKVADASEMTTVEDVVEEGMVPVYVGELNDGTYAVKVESSSSMFRITDCELTVADGAMTAVLTMGGASYAYVYPGTADEAASADAADLIPSGESPEGNNVFTIPVSALDAGVNCAAFSKNREQWYPRTLLFRSDSLPLDAFRELVTAESLGLTMADSPYAVEVTLSGGSGRASIQSPAWAWVQEDGTLLASIAWSSSNYDYMIVDGEKILPLGGEQQDPAAMSTFMVPVRAFDRPLSVVADTTAMSQPYEIEYTLRFDSSTIQKAETAGNEAAP